MNYFTRQEMGQIDVISEDYPAARLWPVVGQPFFDTQQARDIKWPYVDFYDRETNYIAFDFSVLNADGRVTIHRGESGTDDRILI